MVCGCQPSDYGDCHGDIRKVTTLNITGSADATGLPLDQVAANLSAALAYMVANPDPTTKSIHEHGEHTHTHDDVVDCSIIKSTDESRVTVGLAYPHNKPDVSVAADGHIDYAGRTAVEKACWAFTSKSRSIGLHHKDGTEGHGEVVESGIHRGPDWIIKGDNGQDTTIKDGDWVMAVRWDEPTWGLIKSKRLNGFSPQGRAKRGTPAPGALAQLRSN